jgi:hypothetical protein
MMRNLLYFNMLCFYFLLSGCDQSVKNDVTATRAEKIELCQKASAIYMQHHAQYAQLELKKTLFSVASNGNALVHFTFQPALSSIAQQIIDAGYPKLSLRCQFSNDYEYRFLSRYEEGLRIR